MKIRIASSIALAAAIALGASGCSLVASQATLEPYAPSDGIDVSISGVDVRNLMLIAGESGESFNVVFGAVNRTGEPQDVAISFTGEGSQQARAEFTVPVGSTLFGDPEGEEAPVLVEIPDLIPGATVDANFQAVGAAEVQRDVPVLDGTLEEYRSYVLPADFNAAEEPAAGEELAAEDAEASQSHVGESETAEDAH